MTEATINTIALTAIFFGQAFAAWQTARTAAKAKLAEKALAAATAEAERKAAEVKRTLTASNEKTDAKLNVIHALGNSQNVINLRALVMYASERAERTGEAEDIEAANVAKRQLAEALEKTAGIDPRVTAKADFPLPINQSAETSR